jgi:hypothetical protein
MKLIEVTSNVELQTLIQRLIDDTEALGVKVDELDREIEIISNEVFNAPTTEGYDA